MHRVTSARRKAAASAVVAVLALLAAMLGPLGTTPAQAAQAATKQLRVSTVSVACECGGAGYLWGWQVVSVEFKGARKGHTYKLSVKGGPTVDAWAYGRTGYASVSRDQAGFETGKTYRFKVKEFRGKRLVRSTKFTKYTIPTPVAGPKRVELHSPTDEDVDHLVAGETYQVVFSGGEWEEGIRFASGVDAYFGIKENDDRFGWYEEADYPLPWQSNSSEPILEFTPPAEFAGTRWNMTFVGYRPAPKAKEKLGLEKGDPIPGSEWGFSFSVEVQAP